MAARVVKIARTLLPQCKVSSRWETLDVGKEDGPDHGLLRLTVQCPPSFHAFNGAQQQWHDAMVTLASYCDPAAEYGIGWDILVYQCADEDAQEMFWDTLDYPRHYHKD